MTFLSRAEIHRTITTFNIQNSSITTKEPLRFSTKMLNQHMPSRTWKVQTLSQLVSGLWVQHTHTCSLKHFCSLEWPTRYDLDPLLWLTQVPLYPVKTNFNKEGAPKPLNVIREPSTMTCSCLRSGGPCHCNGQGPRQVEAGAFPSSVTAPASTGAGEENLAAHWMHGLPPRGARGCFC